MYHYMALVCDASDANSIGVASAIQDRVSQTVPHYNEVLRENGLIILDSGGNACTRFTRLAQGAGGVLGTLFRREAAQPAAVREPLTPLDSKRIVESAARRLIDAYWGRYVAIVRDASHHRTFILRDPTGCLDCYYTMHRDVHLFFSNIDDVLKLGLIPLAVNFHSIPFVAAGLSLPQGQTCLQGVEELRGGECLQLDPAAQRRVPYWNSADVARTELIEDPRRAASTLRNVIETCTCAWASCYSRIIHCLSGGLDSSIVLSCLMRVPVGLQVTALNYYARDCAGDERRYARLVAHGLGCRLVERLEDADSVRFDLAGPLAHSMTPGFSWVELLHGPCERDLAASERAEALFQGGGGDGILLQSGAQHAPVDFVRRHGVTPALLRVARDSARISRQSAWTLARTGIIAGLRRKPLDISTLAAKKATFLRTELIDALHADQALSWSATLAATRDIPPGKQWHIFLTSLPPRFCRPYRCFERPEIIFPLLSQPIHELCLRIPTYVLFDGGWDRATARQAFQSDLPREITRRRQKGVADCVTAGILRTNLPFIRDALLDGVLARERIVDRRALEGYFQTMRPGGLECNRAMRLFDLELFLRTWLGIPQPHPVRQRMESIRIDRTQ